MNGNPLLLVFLGIAVLFAVAAVGLAVMQRRLLRDQKRAVEELLREARQLAPESDEPDDAC